ncbi:MAG: hypothetical protein K0B02_03220 [DPANN group archaeon]|nr:hypothetical protein [DPANN group archaeon]
MLDYYEFELLVSKYLEMFEFNNEPRRCAYDLLNYDYKICENVTYRDREALMIIEKNMRKRGNNGIVESLGHVTIAKTDFDDVLSKLGYTKKMEIIKPSKIYQIGIEP